MKLLEGKLRNKKYFYNEFAQDFDSKMNMYDTQKRVRIVFNILLKDCSLKGKKLLDAGCGTGWFSKEAAKRKANVTSLDVGQSLLNEVAKKCKSKRVVGDVLNLPFKDGSFDIVVSSEVIEHTTNPQKAIKELLRVLKSSGVLVLTTPNKNWHFSIVIANKLRLRPYQGYENWLNRKEIAETIQKNNGIIKKMLGFHIIPFISPVLYPLIDYFDRFGEKISPLMLNLGFKIIKIN